ncbi:methionine ABC transporter ATP-binding protein [Budvicia aquatica]|uniref:ABC transporter ATP-binding protein n=1 Tax=Budvicia aquatica TaxID=82979 RepID=A0A2C6DG11_9GAMM|nr:ATP-binding cassette domain-containing protein [Budvicia aquatica]PHI28147.1 ABC transporter ATP-binding protein [Budvicia aquatica]VFS45953.1 Methionine import ATP-binding protein MetN [Budvicia aquatica]
MIKIRNLSKHYADRQILRDINLEICRGEIHGLLGISGAGKSTLLRCINGLESFDDNGSLTVDGVEINRLPVKRLREFRKKIGMIFQDFALLQRKTVIENVMLPMQCWQQDIGDIPQRAWALLKLVGIEDKAHFRPQQISGGQKQRVAIARALALEPQILLCDEATSALDPITTKSILDLLKEINQRLNITIVMVTHQMDVVKAACDRLSIIEQGELIATNSVEQIFIENPPALQRITGDIAMRFMPGQVGFKITLPSTELSTSILLGLSAVVNQAFTIFFTQTDYCKTASIVHYYITTENQYHRQVIAYLKSNAVAFQELTSPIIGMTHN